MAKSMFGLAVVAIASAFAIMLSKAHSEDAPKGDPKPGESDWPCWRGPDHNGVAPSSPKLADSWPKEGPKLLWRSGYIKSADGGWSSCAVADGKVYAYYVGCVPKDGSPNFRPFTSEILAKWGWREDVPAELVKKIEDERKTEDWHKVLHGDWKNKAAMEAPAKKFIAGLDPKLAEKYADVIAARLIPQADFPGGGCALGLGWEVLERLARNKDKEFKGYRDFAIFCSDKIGINDGSYGEAIGAMFSPLGKGNDTLVCLDANSGKDVWRKEFDGSPLKYDYAGSCTPVVANGQVYLGGMYGLYCCSARDGAAVWQKKLERPGNPYSSPLVLKGILISCAEGGVSGYDAETGKLLWTEDWQVAQGGKPSPVVWERDGKAYIIYASWHLSCIDPASGKIVWQVKEGGGDLTTPVISGDYVQVAHGTKLRVYKMTPEKAELVWERKDYTEGYSGSALIYQDCIYESHDGIERCLDLKTGDVKWTTKDVSYEYSSPCIVDGKVFGYQRWTDHEIHMWRPRPEKFELLGQFRPKFENLIPGEKGDNFHIRDVNYITSPAIANGKLYVRMVDSVYCYDLIEAGNR